MWQPEPKPDEARWSGCFVGLLETGELWRKEYTNYLSADERAEYLCLPNQTRKSRWLAARLLAKYLFLNRLEASQQTHSESRVPSLTTLTADDLDAYSPWMYQKVEVLPNGKSPSRYRKLVWCAKERQEFISLSHTLNLSCVSIASGQPVVVDIETTGARLEAFYRKNFSDAERFWAVGDGEGETSADWLFTLLWTLKESAMKLGWQQSLWNLPRIELAGLPGKKGLRAFSGSKTMGSDFFVFGAKVQDPGRAMKVQVAVNGNRNVVLTLMISHTGVVNEYSKRSSYN